MQKFSALMVFHCLVAYPRALKAMHLILRNKRCSLPATRQVLVLVLLEHSLRRIPLRAHAPTCPARQANATSANELGSARGGARKTSAALRRICSFPPPESVRDSAKSRCTRVSPEIQRKQSPGCNQPTLVSNVIRIISEYVKKHKL